MGMPQFPKRCERPSWDNLLKDMTEAFLLAEMAGTHLINAQGERMQALVALFEAGKISFCELENGMQGANAVIGNLVMSQWLQQNKLASLRALQPNEEAGSVFTTACEKKYCCCSNCQK